MSCQHTIQRPLQKKQNTDKKARVFLEPEKFERFFETLEGFVDFLKIPRICVSNK